MTDESPPPARPPIYADASHLKKNRIHKLQTRPRNIEPQNLAHHVLGKGEE